MRHATKRSPPKTTGSAESPFRRFFANLGPGLITGAADDDPSGISTYSIAGAAFGYTPLWIALFSFPLMAAVQLMCARLGMVTGKGLAGVVRHRYPKGVLWLACAILLVANVINVAADLGGMAEATALVTGIPAPVWTPLYALLIVALLIWWTYRTIARVFKWLTLVLFAYVGAAFLAHPNLWAVLQHTFIPHFERSAAFFGVLVGVLGTTISPYLFFWQASQEVEEERAIGRNLAERRGATAGELRIARADILTGMFFSNVIMYFIILTTAATLHAGGHTQIGSAREAAEALKPIAGEAAYLLFTLGLIGTGMLGIPVLAGSGAYAIAEAAAWRGSLARPFRGARKFYVVIGVSMLIGLGLNFLGYSAVTMLFWAAVLNGLLAPPLVLLIVLLTSDPTVMHRQVSGPILRLLGWATFVVMSLAAIGLAWMSH